ncbi:50S ribosomal protein L7/L12 [Burkholderia sp. SJ98]|nr:50S ribosomal protein L7/L12 [Burkholderia sp. SJ98]
MASSAAALGTASLMGFGAPSTRSFASFRPRPVSSRTALMTETLFAPASSRFTVNSVCSSAAAAAPPAPAGPATATAAADTPNFSSNALTSSFSSSTDIEPTASRMSSFAIAM